MLAAAGSPPAPLDARSPRGARGQHQNLAGGRLKQGDDRRRGPTALAQIFFVFDHFEALSALGHARMINALSQRGDNNGRSAPSAPTSISCSGGFTFSTKCSSGEVRYRESKLEDATAEESIGGDTVRDAATFHISRDARETRRSTLRDAGARRKKFDERPPARPRRRRLEDDAPTPLSERRDPQGKARGVVTATRTPLGGHPDMMRPPVRTAAAFVREQSGEVRPRGCGRCGRSLRSFPARYRRRDGRRARRDDAGCGGRRRRVSFGARCWARVENGRRRTRASPPLRHLAAARSKGAEAAAREAADARALRWRSAPPTSKLFVVGRRAASPRRRRSMTVRARLRAAADANSLVEFEGPSPSPRSSRRRGAVGCATRCRGFIADARSRSRPSRARRGGRSVKRGDKVL